MLNPFIKTSCSLGGLLTLFWVIFLAAVAWNGDLSTPTLTDLREVSGEVVRPPTMHHPTKGRWWTSLVIHTDRGIEQGAIHDAWNPECQCARVPLPVMQIKAGDAITVWMTNQKRLGGPDAYTIFQLSLGDATLLVLEDTLAAQRHTRDQMAVLLAVWFAAAIGLLLWGLRKAQGLTRDRRNNELMGLIYAVVGIPAMLVTVVLIAYGYFEIVKPPAGSGGSMTPLEIAGFLAVIVVGCIVGAFGVGVFLATAVGKWVLGFTRADFEAMQALASFPTYDRYYWRLLDVLFGKPDPATLAARQARPPRTVISLSLWHILGGVATGILMLVAFGWLLVGSGLLPPESQAWVLSNLQQIIKLVVLVVVVVVLGFQHRRLTHYHHGDNPIAKAQVLLAFGRRRMAIRYLEDALRHNPGSPEILRAVQTLLREKERL